MNQDELIQRLKEVAEYVGEKVELDNGITQVMVSKADKVEFYQPIVTTCKYHTSFDWSVPVWSKAFKEHPEIAMNYSLQAAMYIDDNNPLQFFINLSDLIREIKKYQ